jgi:hypothetical protein
MMTASVNFRLQMKRAAETVLSLTFVAAAMSL